MKDKEPKDSLDKAIDAIKADQPTSKDIMSARDRVHAQIKGDLKDVPGVQLNSSEDYIAAIPDYLANRLSDSQRILFEDESRQSLTLRRELKAARQTRAAEAETVKESRSPRLRWFASAAAVLVVALGTMLVLPELPTLDQSELAQVAEVNGTLYKVADGQLQPLSAGEWISGQTNVRTGKDSLAVLFLDDGSRVEVNGRSEISVTRRSSGNRIDVERGNIIVEASPQGSGTLDVATNEFVVSVTGTIFEVGHGAMGSMVGVIEGQVEVLQKGDSTSVTPGEQMGSRTGLDNYDVAAQLAWSRDGDKYIAMLKSVTELQRGISAAMETEPRFSTRLLDLVPANTAVYLAVPNAPEKITAVYDMMRTHMQQEGFSDVMENIDHASENQNVDELMSWLGEVGEELGEETVVSMTIHGHDNELKVVPVVLSEVDSSAFAANFDSRVQSLYELWEESARTSQSGQASSDDHPEIVLLDSPGDALSGNLSIWLTGDLLVATTDADVMVQMETILANQQSGFADSKFHGKLSESYSDGAEFLAGVHLAEVLSRVEGDAEKLRVAGFADAEFLIAESMQSSEQTILDASLLFSDERTGAMSWLANPGPMGALEFFSVYTTMVTSFVLKDPSVIVEEIEQMTANFQKEVDSTTEGFTLDLDWKSDVIATLGGEVAIGLDGPAFPTPGWKVVVEVYNELQLQQSIESVIAQMNQQAIDEEKSLSITINPADVSPYTGYKITVSAASGPDSMPHTMSVQYAFIDGYLVATPNMALLDKAITLYQSRAGLMTSQVFIDRLPGNAGLDFSAMTFSRVGQLIADLVDHMPSNLSPEQQNAIKQFTRGSEPTLLSVYATSDSLRFIHNGSTDLPFSISQLLSLKAITGLGNGDELDEMFGEGFEKRLEEGAEQRIQQKFEARIEARIERDRNR